MKNPNICRYRQAGIPKSKVAGMRRPILLMKTQSIILALAAAFLTALPQGLYAQEHTVVTASRSIEHFEVDAGLEFQTREVANGNVSTFGIKKIQRWATDSRSTRIPGPEFEFISRHSNELSAGSAASGRYLFSAGANGILRFKRQSPNPDSEAPSILATSGSVPWFSSAGFPNGSDLAIIGDRVYWGEVDGTRVQIWSHGLELGGFSVLHSEATYSGGGAFKIKRLVQFSPSQGLALTFNGLLYSFKHDDLFTVLNGTSAMTLLASDVTGFDTRTDTVSAGGFTSGQTAVYFTVRNPGQSGAAPATVQRRRYLPLTGWTNPTTLYSSKLGASGFFDSLTEVVLNAKYIYLRRAAVSLFLGSPIVAPADGTFRADNPADVPINSLAMAAIPADGNNLRSDNLFLYYARGAGIYRVAANVAPIPIVKLDFEALGLEVTQAVQTLDHRVNLVMNKRTFVRGFARERINQNTGVISFSPSARLRVFFRPAFPLNVSEVELTNPINPLAPPPGWTGSVFPSDARALSPLRSCGNLSEKIYGCQPCEGKPGLFYGAGHHPIARSGYAALGSLGSGDR